MVTIPSFSLESARHMELFDKLELLLVVSHREPIFWDKLVEAGHAEKPNGRRSREQGAGSTRFQEAQDCDPQG